VNVVFHALTGFGIAHVAARSLEPEPPVIFARRDLPLLAATFVAGVLSHGVLDGLKHGYPVLYMIDPPLALLMLVLWLALVSRRYRLLVLVAFAGAIFPDVLDLGGGVTRFLLGLPRGSSRHLFPWHWLDGSGSMYPSANRNANPRLAKLDVGDNQVVSITNHAIVIFFACAAVLSNRRPFRAGAAAPTPAPTGSSAGP
jgi:hypothetical protein